MHSCSRQFVAGDLRSSLSFDQGMSQSSCHVSMLMNRSSLPLLYMLELQLHAWCCHLPIVYFVSFFVCYSFERELSDICFG
uniref:Uncharacterized protein n=1 Tax=Arundo donax TaxID=35708 RepID=A0A0A9KV44_ARUDO